MSKFSHIKNNKVEMVDLSGKKKSLRESIATSTIKFPEEAYKKIKISGSPKGEIFTTARIAGIQAAKKTSDFIPLCHNIKINFISIDFTLSDEFFSITAESKVRTTEITGVEMEALISASIATLTIYDMCKSIDKGLIIECTKLKYKSGGKSGIYKDDIL